MKIAKEKVWSTRSGKLVKDGHGDAEILVAAKGQVVPPSAVEKFDGAAEFFDDLNPHPKTVPSTRARGGEEKPAPASKPKK